MCCLWTEQKLNGFRVLNLEFGGKSKKLAEFKLQELPLLECMTGEITKSLENITCHRVHTLHTESVQNRNSKNDKIPL